MELNNRKIVNAWCFYDWANSAYSLVITSTIFPIYYNIATRAEFGSDDVTFFGYPIVNTVLYSYAISVSYLLISFVTPLLSGIADYGGKKSRFMQMFVLLGALACLSLYGFTGKNIELGIIAFGLATIGYSGSIVFYNAFLPEIVSPDRYDNISARGYAYGYVGSVLLLILNLLTIQYHEAIGVSEDNATRLAFLMVGIWWIGFSLITFRHVKDDNRNQVPINKEMLQKGFRELRQVAKEVKYQKYLKLFLASFFFYSMGVQTIMFLAATFAEKELKMQGQQLILTVLILQIVAIAGAYLFSNLSEKIGNKKTLLLIIFIWVGTCIAAYYVQTTLQFYGVAAVIGSIMGGIQSLSRSTYSKLLPPETLNTASYFSFYDILEKFSIMLGTFAYGYIEMVTHSMRNSIICLGGFFLLGAFLMMKTQIITPAKRI